MAAGAAATLASANVIGEGYRNRRLEHNRAILAQTVISSLKGVDCRVLKQVFKLIISQPVLLRNSDLYISATCCFGII